MQRYARVDNGARFRKGTVKEYLITQKLIRKINELDMEEDRRDFLIANYIDAPVTKIEKILKSKDIKETLYQIKYKNG
jgi:hypothetical protein